MKTALKILLLLAVAAALIYSVVNIFTSKREVVMCTGMDITITDSLSTGLIHEKDVRNILRKCKVKTEGLPIDSVNNAEIIDVLSQSPYVDTASCYHTPAGRVCVDVIAKQPVLHVMAENGEEYYLDRKGRTMPIGGLNVNLNIATGKITKSFAAQNLTKLACYIQDNSFWQPLIQQINVLPSQKVQLVMRISDIVVDLGEAAGYEQKLDKLHLFMTQGLNQAGWNKYKSVDVSYRNIVVGTLAEGVEKQVATIPIEVPQPAAQATPTQSEQGGQQAQQSAASNTSQGSQETTQQGDQQNAQQGGQQNAQQGGNTAQQANESQAPTAQNQPATPTAATQQSANNTPKQPAVTPTTPKQNNNSKQQ